MSGMSHPARETTVGLPTLTRAASFTPGSVDASKRTVEMVWTTGAPVMRGYYNKYWETLSLDASHVRMGRLNNGAPLLNAHQGYDALDVIGVVESARLGTPATATVRFAKAEDSPDADQIFRLVSDGILQKTSVGYNVYRLEQQEDAPDGVPVFMATDWEPCELTVAPIAADDGSGFRTADKQAQTKCVFVTRQQGRTTMATENESNPTTQPASGKPSSAAIEATRAAAAARVEDAKARAEEAIAAAQQATIDERERVAGIRSLARRSKLGDQWADVLIEKGTSVADARAAAFDSMADDGERTEIHGFTRISAEEDQREKFIRGASAWMFERTGTRELLERAVAKDPRLFRGEKIEFDGGEYRGYRPVELARMCLERNGVRTAGMDSMKMIGQAFMQRSGPGQTTGDFPILLENVLGKVLLGAYATQENTWERFCGTDQVPDFRTSNRYRTGSLPSLDVIPEHAEYKNAVIPDGSKYALTTQRTGKMFAVSQETIINDDMGALTQMAMELGRSGMRTIENAVYALLALNSGLGPTQADAQPFFHANRANVGTGAALAALALDADRVLMRAQKDPNNLDFLDLNPTILLVPDALRGTADVINDSQYDPDTANKLQRKNLAYKMFNDIIGTPRLSASSTRRYLFSNPSVAAAIVIVFLEGYGRSPVMETRDGWRVDGVEWKVSLYAKAQMADPKAAVTNAGA